MGGLWKEGNPKLSQNSCRLLLFGLSHQVSIQFLDFFLEKKPPHIYPSMVLVNGGLWDPKQVWLNNQIKSGCPHFKSLCLSLLDSNSIENLTFWKSLGSLKRCGDHLLASLRTDAFKGPWINTSNKLQSDTHFQSIKVIRFCLPELGTIVKCY